MKPTQAQWTRFRIYTIFGIFLAAWVGLIWRAAELQIHERDRYVTIAEKEYSREIKIVPVRGDIFDRNMEKLAVSLRVDSIYAVPPRIEDVGASSIKLARILKIDRRTLSRKLVKNKYFVWIKRKVDPDTAAQVRAAKIPGIYFYKESKRFYPNMSLAAHVLGFVGLDSQGLEGLEVSRESQLKMETASIMVLQDALGRKFQDRASQTKMDVKGASLVLTIDSRIQYAVEKALDRATKIHNAKKGMAVVVRPRTGEILAMAVSPSFNPNAFRSYSRSYWRNRVVTDAFDPGSTFKAFLVAAALEEGVVTAEDLINCEKGTLNIGRRVIHDSRPFGWLSVGEVVKYSSNIGAVKISRRLGQALFYDYLTKFGFGSKTGVDLPGESAGLLRPYDKWTDLDLANIAFGQGVSVTAIQMVMAIASLANDGVLMRPYVVSRVIDASGKTIQETRPRAVRRVVSPENAWKVRQMLRMVVEEGGTGVLAEPAGYLAAGKTGTAQKLDKKSGRYSTTKYVSSFIGIMPYKDPELAVLVALDEPGPAIFGGVVAGPVFKEIGEKVLPLLNIAPENNTPRLTKTDESRQPMGIVKITRTSVKPG